MSCKLQEGDFHPFLVLPIAAEAAARALLSLKGCYSPECVCPTVRMLCETRRAKTACWVRFSLFWGYRKILVIGIDPSYGMAEVGWCLHRWAKAVFCAVPEIVPTCKARQKLGIWSMWGEKWPGKHVGERSSNSLCHLAEVPRFPQPFHWCFGGRSWRGFSLLWAQAGFPVGWIKGGAELLSGEERLVVWLTNSETGLISWDFCCFCVQLRFRFVGVQGLSAFSLMLIGLKRRSASLFGL